MQDLEDTRDRRGFKEFRVSVVILVRKETQVVKDLRAMWDHRDPQVHRDRSDRWDHRVISDHRDLEGFPDQQDQQDQQVQWVRKV